MSVHFRGSLFLSLSLLFVASFFGNADEQIFEVVGVGECADCKENNFNENEAFSGLHVTIDCKLKIGVIMRVGAAKLDEQGNFKLQLPQEAIEQASQKLKEDCYAQLHNAAAVPCPAHGGLETTKITFKSYENGKFIFSPAKSLRFSTPLCTSKFFKKRKFHRLPYPRVPIYKPEPKPPMVKPHPAPIPIQKPKLKKPILPVTKPPPHSVPLFPRPPIHEKPSPSAPAPTPHPLVHFIFPTYFDGLD